MSEPESLTGAAQSRTGPTRGPKRQPVAGPKTGSSDSRVAANRANSKHSTGPRTTRGKNVSRFNGLKHVLRAELPVLPGEDPEALRDRLDLWMLEQGPRTDLERHLVERAVRASWRL